MKCQEGVSSKTRQIALSAFRDLTNVVRAKTQERGNVSFPPSTAKDVTQGSLREVRIAADPRIRMDHSRTIQPNESPTIVGGMEESHRQRMEGIMSKKKLAAALISVMLGASAMAAQAEDFHADLNGFHEVGVLGAITGAISTEGRGTLDLKLDRRAQTLTFKLTFENMSAPVIMSHIHLGQVHTAGGVMVFFCSNNGGPAGTQPCPGTSGTVTGTITAANVLALPGQHLSAGDFDALVDALENNSTYVNVHTTTFPTGEIRGEIRHRDRDEE